MSISHFTLMVVFMSMGWILGGLITHNHNDNPSIIIFSALIIMMYSFNRYGKNVND